MTPRYKVTLTEEERGLLEALTRSGKTAASKFIHARALLLCDAGEHGSPWNVADVATALGSPRAPSSTSSSGSLRRGSKPPWCANPRSRHASLPSTEPLRRG